VPDPSANPFCLPLFHAEFALAFDLPITIIVGENGTGKPTLLEGIAAMGGYDDAGGGKGDRPVDHSTAIEATADAWRRRCGRAGCRRLRRAGFSTRKASFPSLAISIAPPDFLSHSHGEGFLRFFDERCRRRGIFIFDEPESALSPSRQILFLRRLRRMEQLGHCQVIMATHSTVLMAYPGARLLLLSKYGLAPASPEETEHFGLTREFCADPRAFVDAGERPMSGAKRSKRSSRSS